MYLSHTSPPTQHVDNFPIRDSGKFIQYFVGGPFFKFLKVIDVYFKAQFRTRKSRHLKMTSGAISLVELLKNIS